MSNNKLISDKTNGKLKEIGMIMDNQDPAFDHSTLEELDKKRQDMGKIWKKHGIENELEIKDLAPAFDHSTLEELDKKRQDMGKIWTKHEIKDELEAVKEKNDYLIRSKRNVDDDIIWEILSKIVPRKQAMLFNMASNDLLTVGSIEFDDYQNEIATITNVNAEQLLDYDVKDFENLKESFGKEIFYKIAPKRMEKIIRDAEDKFENVLGIYSALKMVEKDNKEIDETIQNIEEAEEKLKTEGVSVDDYCKKECTALSEYDEKIANEIEKEKNKQEIKKEVKGKEEHKDRIKEIKRHPEAEEMKETDKEKGEERHTKTGEMKESDIIESEIEHQEQPPEAIHNTNGVLSKVYNKSKEHMGNVAKFVGNKSWEIASHIGNKVVQASSNAWSKKTENTSKIGGSSQKLETPGTSKEPKETNKGDKGKGIEEIVESEIEDQGVQLEASGHSEGALSKIYNKSKENLGNVGKYVGKKSWEIASHYGNKLVQTAINTMTRKSENTKPENTSQIVGSDQPTAKIPGTAHIRLGHQIYQRKTEEPK